MVKVRKNETVLSYSVFPIHVILSESLIPIYDDKPQAGQPVNTAPPHLCYKGFRNYGE